MRRRIVLLAFLVPVILVSGMIGDVQWRYRSKIMRASPVSQKQPKQDDLWIIILGASVRKNGTPSDALRDRLDEGLELYHALSDRILISGDDGGHRVDEISVMKRYLLERGVLEQDLFIDTRGYRTYETCKNASERFQIRKAILVTQRFHLSRALYLCRQLGVDAIGSVADRQSYDRILYFWTRDLAASAKAWWDIHIFPPKSPVSSS